MRAPFANLLVGVLLSAGAAEAAKPKPKPTPPPTEEEQKRKQARDLFLEGETFYNLLKYEEALKKYEEAYLVSQEPDLLFNIAQCYRRLDRKPEAIAAYKNFLRERPSSPVHEDAAQFIVELEAALAAEKTPPPPPPPAEKGGFLRALTPEDPTLPSLAWFAGAGAAGASALVLGGLSLRAARQAAAAIPADENPFVADPLFFTERSARKDQALRLGLVADLVGVVALGLGGYGYLVKRAEDQREARAQLQSDGRQLSLQVRF